MFLSYNNFYEVINTRYEVLSETRVMTLIFINKTPLLYKSDNAK
jgi:hypothetical protein